MKRLARSGGSWRSMAVVLCLMNAGTALHAQTYQVKDVGALSDELPGHACGSTARGLNLHGQVVGESPNASFRTFGFVTDANGDNIRSLGTLRPFGEPASRALSINDNGRVVGRMLADLSFISGPNGGSLQEMPPVFSADFPLGASTYANAINATAQVTGGLYGTRTHAFITAADAGELTDLDTSSAVFFRVARAINTGGQVAGGTDAFCDGGLDCGVFVTGPNGGGTRYLGRLGTQVPFAGRPASALGINDKGELAGYSYTADFAQNHAFYSNGSSLTDIHGGLGVSSQANGINYQSQAVGQYRSATNVARAFVWDQATGTRDLTALLEPGSGWTLLDAAAINDKGQIAATGTNPAVLGGACPHAVLLTPVACVDTDGDGLCDDWEINGVKDAQGTVILDLPSLGADPRKKDVFVHLDYMVGSDGHQHMPKDQALKLVTQAFARAPADLVRNPDGQRGINLHILLGQAIPETKDLATLGTGPSCATSTPHYTCAEQGLRHLRDQYFPPERRFAFRYAVFGHAYTFVAPCGEVARTSTGFSSGLTDLAVTLTAFIRASPPLTGQDITRLQAGTLMHELGHTLGLDHGGSADDTNDKPNYLSVMNYLWQATGLLTDPDQEHVFDYSIAVLPTLDETGLAEPIGIAASGKSKGYFSQYACPTTGAAKPRWKPLRFNRETDWNCDGSIQSAPVADANINADKLNCTTAARQTALSGASDWDHLSYARGSIGYPGQAPNSAAAGHSESTATEAAMQRMWRSIEHASKLRRPYAIRAAADIEPDRLERIAAGATRTIRFMIENTGEQPDTVVLHPLASEPVADFSRLPRTLQLAPGAKAQVEVVLTAPKTGLTSIVEIALQPVSAHRAIDITESTSVMFAPEWPGRGDPARDRAYLQPLFDQYNRARNACGQAHCGR